jgi:hypothetical protein
MAALKKMDETPALKLVVSALTSDANDTNQTQLGVLTNHPVAFNFPIQFVLPLYLPFRKTAFDLSFEQS